MTEEKIKEYKDIAAEFRAKGYNCAQCVMMALADCIGLDSDSACKIGAGLGSGIAGRGEICGAINAAAIAEGLLHGTSPEERKLVVMNVGQMFDRFKDENGGRVRCRDLKGKEGVRPCIDLIRQAVGIFIEHHDKE